MKHTHTKKCAMSTIPPVAFSRQVIENHNFTIQSEQLAPEHCFQ